MRKGGGDRKKEEYWAGDGKGLSLPKESFIQEAMIFDNLYRYCPTKTKGGQK